MQNEFYLVQATTADGVTFTHEATLAEASREKIVEGIATGDYDVGKIDRVIKVDLAQNQALDVSVLVAGEIEQWSYAHQREVAASASEFLRKYGMDPYTKPEPEYRRVSRGYRHLFIHH